MINDNKEEIEVGDTVTASYSVTGGSGEYTNIQLEWLQKVTGSSYWSSVKFGSTFNGDDLSTTGTYSYTSTIEGELKLQIFVEDTERRSIDATSIIVKVRDKIIYNPGEPDFILPSSVEIIDKDVFRGISAEYIYIQDSSKEIKIKDGAFSNNSHLRFIYLPANVKEISVHAFDNTNCIILAPENSYAAEWAELNNRRFQIYNQ